MYHLLEITNLDDFDKLSNLLPPEYSAEEVILLLEAHLSTDVKSILIETGYVDRDYRSTYYSFYSKKGLKYSAFCARLHFFKEGVQLNNRLELVSSIASVEDRYVGYMVLRPTQIAPIGRTVLSVHAKQDMDGAIIESRHHVHVLGYRFEVMGFPYMQQHTDISVCAHVVCWSILRHYSQRHYRYAEFLVDDITQMSSPSKVGGLMPSRGLRVEQACRIFTHAGLYPDVYRKEDFKGDEFYRILHGYVESGFPIFAAMHEKQHAVTVIGHGKPDKTGLDGCDEDILFSWQATNSLVVIDDNHMPYLLIDCLDAGPYKLTEIDAFVVPLPEKIYLPYEAAEAQVVSVLRYGFDRMDFSNLYGHQPVVRCFATTTPNFRKYLRDQQSAYPPNLFQALMNIVLPQFVWVAQVSTVNEWQQNRVEATFLLDATASAAEENPFFLIHDQKTAFLYDRAESGEQGWLSFGAHTYGMTSQFRQNLTYRH
jgi:hypothetical protein